MKKLETIILKKGGILSPNKSFMHFLYMGMPSQYTFLVQVKRVDWKGYYSYKIFCPAQEGKIEIGGIEFDVRKVTDKEIHLRYWGEI